MRIISLRDWDVKDLEAYAYWLQPEHEWHHWDGPYFPKTPLEEIPALIAARRERILQGNFSTPRRNRVIVDPAQDTLLGSVSWYWIGEETHWPAVGIVIYDPAYWQKGIGYQALGLWSDYLFEAEPRFVRLDLRTWSGNHRMMKLALKLGYQEEARFRNARIVNGEYFDGMGYGILREEWLARYPNGFAASLK